MHTAIRLWFEGGDPASIHTLASAAHDLVHEKFRSKGLHGLVFDSPLIGPRHKQKWSGLFKNPANFLKHGRHDPEGTVEFDTVLSEALLMACCKGLSSMELLVAPEELALTYWYLFTRPEFASRRERALQSPKVQFIQQLALKGREVYFREFMAASDAGIIVAGAFDLSPQFSLEKPQ